MAGNNETRSVEVIIKGTQASSSIKEIRAAAAVLNSELNKLPVNTKAFTDKKAELDAVRGRLKDISGQAKEVHQSFGAMAKGFVIGTIANRAAGAVKDFVTSAVGDFVEAEKNANDLKFALVNIGHEGAFAFNQLIEQSAKLQEEGGIFSDDDIQKIQTMQVQFGLTASEVEKLTPVILDYAAAQGIDAASATDTCLKAINGQTKGLKTAGAAFDDQGTKLKNITMLTEKLTKFQGANAQQLETLAGKTKRLENIYGEFKESVGQFLVNEGTQLLDYWDVLTGKTTFAEKSLNDYANKYKATFAQKEQEMLKKAKDNNVFRLQEMVKVNHDIVTLAQRAQHTTSAEQQKFIAIQIKQYQDYYQELKSLGDAKVVDFVTKEKKITKEVIDQGSIRGRNAEAEYDKMMAERAKADAEALLAQQKAADEAVKLKEDVEDQMFLLSLDANNKEIVAEAQKWDKIIEEAAKAGLDVTELRKWEADAIALIAQDQANREIEITKKKNKETLDMAVSMTGELASRVTSMLQSYSQIQKNHDDEQIEQLDRTYSEQERKTEELYRAKLLTEKEYNARQLKEKNAHERKVDKIKKEAAEREKKIAVATAIINGIVSVVKTLAQYAYPYNLVLAALDAAVVGAQVAAIKSTPVAYADGDIVDKPTYGVFGEAGPEALIPLSPGKRSRGKELWMESGRQMGLLNNWMTETPSRMNVTGQLDTINQSRSGSYQSSSSTKAPVFNNSDSTGGNSNPSNNEISFQLKRLNDHLDEGIGVSYDKFNRSMDKVNNAKGSARV
jgi:hypothetical protein